MTMSSMSVNFIQYFSMAKNNFAKSSEEIKTCDKIYVEISNFAKMNFKSKALLVKFGISLNVILILQVHSKI